VFILFLNSLPKICCVCAGRDLCVACQTLNVHKSRQAKTKITEARNETSHFIGHNIQQSPSSSLFVYPLFFFSFPAAVKCKTCLSPSKERKPCHRFPITSAPSKKKGFKFKKKEKLSYFYWIRRCLGQMCGNGRYGKTT